MESLRRKVRRRQLDGQLSPFATLTKVPIPNGGWIRAIRQALGMTLDQYARRLGLASGSTAFQLEHAEVEESISIRRMRSAADALGCDLVIALIPREPLESLAERQALRKATERLARVGHTMAMEAQNVRSAEMEVLLKQTASELLDRGGSRLWD